MASDQVTLDDIVKVAKFVGEQNCIPLANELGLGLLYANKLKSTSFNDIIPQKILLDWQAANGSDATKDVLCCALNKIGRRDLADEITPKRQTAGEMKFIASMNSPD